MSGTAFCDCVEIDSMSEIVLVFYLIEYTPSAGAYMDANSRRHVVNKTGAWGVLRDESGSKALGNVLRAMVFVTVGRGDGPSFRTASATARNVEQKFVPVAARSDALRRGPSR